MGHSQKEEERVDDMNRKRMILLTLMLALSLMISGCAKDEPPVSGQIEPNPTQSSEVVTTTAPATVPTQAATEETVPPETSEVPESTDQESAALGRLEGGTYTNSYAGYGCQLDESWVYYSAEELQTLPDNIEELLADSELAEGMAQISQIMDMQAENADELATINVLYSKLGLQERLAYMVLTEEQVMDSVLEQKDMLVQSYTQMGMEVSSMEKVQVEFLGQEHWAMKTQAMTQGVPYYTLQIMDYTAGQYGVTLTVSSFVEDKTQQLLDLFYAVE